jgi:hypothetical protein
MRTYIIAAVTAVLFVLPLPRIHRLRLVLAGSESGLAPIIAIIITTTKGAVENCGKRAFTRKN